MTKESTDLRAV